MGEERMSLSKGSPPASYFEKLASCPTCGGFDNLKVWGYTSNQRYKEVFMEEMISSIKAGCQICGIVHDLWKYLINQDSNIGSDPTKVSVDLTLQANWASRYFLLHFITKKTKNAEDGVHSPDYEIVLEQPCTM